jgi:hypothetical protein
MIGGTNTLLDFSQKVYAATVSLRRYEEVTMT